MSEADKTVDQRLASRRASIKESKAEPIYEHKQDDYLFDAQQNSYWCRAARELREAAAVNSSIPQERWLRIPQENGRDKLVKPSTEIADIRNGLHVQSSTWAPGEPEVMHDALSTRNGIQRAKGWRCYNTYQPGPVADVRLADQAGAWVEHVKRLWPEEAEHGYFFDYCAHMIQKPWEKCNAAIVISGKQGIGKDAALYPLRPAVGEWNAKNIGPDAVLSRFNPWAESLMLTVDEVRPTNDDHKATAMYDAMKTLVTTPPDMLTLENKNVSARYVINRLRIFMTTNDHLAMYIPPEDRRLMVLHSRLPVDWHKAAGDEEYFTRLFNWMDGGGNAAVAGWLAARDISQFNPKGGVPKTETWAEIAQRWEAPEDELSQVLDMLGEPDCVLGSELSEQLFDGAEELNRLMKSRKFVHRMSQAGYRTVPLPKGASYWIRKREGFRVKTSKIYVKDALQLSPEESLKMAQSRMDARAKAGPSGQVPRSEGKITIVAESGK